MKPITFLIGALAALSVGLADAQIKLRQSTSRVVRICGVVAVGDGFTPVTTLDLTTADEAEALRDNTATLDISGATFAAITAADGCYSLTLDTTATNTVGELIVEINDDSLILPVWEKYQVLEEAVFDRDYAASATGNSARVALALPNAAPDAAGGLPISDAGGLDLDAQFAKLGTMPNLGGGANLGQAVRDLAGATFTTSTDSSEAIRNRGDSAWTTGAGGCSSGSVCTTVATAPTTTSVTLTAAPVDDTQPEGFAIYFVDNGDANSYCLRKVSSIATGTITYDAACPFTVAAGDTVELLGAFLDEGVGVTAAAATQIIDEFETQSQADPTGFHVNVLEVGGTAQTANDNGADINAILVDTAEIGAAGAGLTNINLPNQTMDITGTLSTVTTATNVTTVNGLAAGVVTAAAVANAAIDAATFAADVDAEVLSYIVEDATRIDASELNADVDSLVFTKASELDVNVQSANGVTLTGDGSATPFGVAFWREQENLLRSCMPDLSKREARKATRMAERYGFTFQKCNDFEMIQAGGIR